MQEIHALDLEVKRLKEAKAIHKEYRRYVEMPSKYPHVTLEPRLTPFASFLCAPHSRSNESSMRLLSWLEQAQAPVQSRVL